MLRRHGRHPRGQISILIVFSLIPMFTLFAFAINIGMLVHAKISLQTAADMAAYAGAATQARQLTNISHLNYYMRQVYKKFLFKYYVLGNISQKCYPRGGTRPYKCQTETDATKFNWQNVDLQGNPGFPGVPAVCINLSPSSNPCQITKAIHVVKKPACGAIDPTCSAIQSAAEGIAAIQQKACDATSSINQDVLANWLYATNYDSTLQTNEKLQGLVSKDIGLMTEEQLTYERIKNIVDLINEGPKRGVTVAGLDRLEHNDDPAKAERTILAMRTVLGNLNSEVFQPDSIVLSELLENGQKMLTLKPIRTPKFKVGIAFLNQGGGTGQSDCVMALDSFQANPLVGVHKVTDSLVYYAVKVTARARLIFNPFPIGKPADDIELTAYAAAMPFGSRIGPVFSEAQIADEFVKQGTAVLPIAGGGFEKDDKWVYPTLKIDDAGHTYESLDVLKAFADLMNDNTGTGTAGASNLQLGLHAVTIPDLYEIGKYNIPVDTDTLGAETNHQFVSYYQHGSAAGYSMWAPVVGLKSTNSFMDEMQDVLKEIASLAQQANADRMVANKWQLRKYFEGRLATLIGTLRTDSNLQGWNVFRMPDPLSTGFFKSINGNAPSIPGKVKADPSTGPKLATSFTTDHDASYARTGRDGYSVKLIPFKMLLSKPGQLSNDSGQPRWRPVPGAFGTDRDDISKLAH